MIRVAAPECESIPAALAASELKSIGTTTAPRRITPQKATAHQAEFGAQSATRSPLETPIPASRDAMRRDLSYKRS